MKKARHYLSKFFLGGPWLSDNIFVYWGSAVFFGGFLFAVVVFSGFTQERGFEVTCSDERGVEVFKGVARSEVSSGWGWRHQFNLVPDTFFVGENDEIAVGNFVLVRGHCDFDRND